MSFTRDMLPPWELRAALDAAEAREAALTRENEALKAALSTARENALRKAAGVAITPIRFECCNNPTWSGYQEDEPKCCGNPNAEWGNPGEISEAILALIDNPQEQAALPQKESKE